MAGIELATITYDLRGEGPNSGVGTLVWTGSTVLEEHSNGESR
jgi:hypothetical protein